MRCKIILPVSERFERTSPESFDATWPQRITIGEHAADVNDLADFAKMRTIKLMTDIDAGVGVSARVDEALHC